jgi:hypothetical protein
MLISRHTYPLYHRRFVTGNPRDHWGPQVAGQLLQLQLHGGVQWSEMCVPSAQVCSL